MRSFEDSLQRLGMNRVDILLIHDCDEWSQGARYEEALRTVEHGALRALQRLKDEGTIGAFGAGVNQAEACERLMDIGDFDCFMLAGRYTLLEQGALDCFLPRAAAAASRCCWRRRSTPASWSRLAPDARYDYLPAPRNLARVAGSRRVPGARRAAGGRRPPVRAGAPGRRHGHPGSRSRAEAEQNAAWASVHHPTGFWSDLKAAPAASGRPGPGTTSFADYVREHHAVLGIVAHPYDASGRAP